VVRSNIGSKASLGDLADLFDGVSFDPDSNTLSVWVLQITDPKNVINNERGEDSADSGISKVDSYSDFCTNKTYLAHNQVCMVDARRGTEDDDAESEEEYDENGNPRIDRARFGMDGRNRQPPPEQRQATADNAGDNAGGNLAMSMVATQAETPMWKIHATNIESQCTSYKSPRIRGDSWLDNAFMGSNAAREELMAYQYLLHMQKREVIKLKRDLDGHKKAADSWSLN
jgi:hypothetical protein